MTLHFLCHKLVFLISPAPDFYSFHKLRYPLLSVSFLPGKKANRPLSIRADSPHLRYRTSTRPEPASLPSALSHAQGLGLGLQTYSLGTPIANLCHGSHAVDAQPTVPDTTHSGRSLGLHSPCLCEVHFTSICVCVAVNVPMGAGVQPQPRGQDDSAALCAQLLAPFHLSAWCPTVKASSAQLISPLRRQQEELPGPPETS